MPINVTDEHLAVVRAVLSRFFQATDAEILLFGSRVAGTARPDSDLDVLIKQNHEIALSTLGFINEAFEKSALPFKVDIVDFHGINESFRRKIAATAIPLSLKD